VFGSPAIKNCIIWNNSQGGSSQINASGVTYCNIQGGFSGTGNIDSDPLFVNADNGDYRIQDDSPCIDFGDPDTDGDGEDWETDTDDQDPDGTRKDMGCFSVEQIELGYTFAFTQMLYRLTGLDGGSSVAITPDGEYFYNCAYVDNAISMFSRNADDGTLTHMTNHINAGYKEGQMAISSDSDYLYVCRAGYVETMKINDDGSLTLVGEEPGFPSHNARYMALPPDEKHLYVSDVRNNIDIYSRDVTTGLLTRLSRSAVGDARYIAASQDNKNLYGAQYNLAVFSRDATTGAVTNIQSLSYPSGVNADEGIAVSYDGKNVYVPRHSQILVYSRDPSDGRLTFDYVEMGGSHFYNISALVLSRDNSILAVIGYDDTAIMKRDPDTGHLTYIQNLNSITDHPGLHESKDAVFSNDNKNLYITGDDKLVVYTRE